MKKPIFLIFIVPLLTFGCSTTGINQNYNAYLSAKMSILEKSKPTLSIKCPPTGCTFTELSYFDPRDRVSIKQKNPHPAWAFAGTVIKYGTGAYIAHDIVGFMGDAINAAGNTYTNSYNDIGGNNTPITIGNDRGVVGDTYPWIGDDNSERYDNSFNSDDHHIQNEAPAEDIPAEGSGG